MERLKSEFIAKLAQALGNHQEKESILREYDAHLDELLVELYELKDESEVRDQIYLRFGTPEEIATMWKEELSRYAKQNEMAIYLSEYPFIRRGIRSHSCT